MITDARALLAILFLASAIPAHANTDAKPAICQLRELTSIDLVVADDIYVPVSVNGASGLMTLDTMSGGSVFRDAFTKRAGMRRVRVLDDVHTVGSKPVKTLAVFTQFMLGAVRVKADDSFFHVYPPGTEPLATEVKGSPIVGSLGLDLLATMDFELDLAHHKLRLFSHQHCEGNVVYWTTEYATVPLHQDGSGSLSFPVELEGKYVEAVLSTATAKTTITTDVTQKLFGFDEHSHGVSTEVDSDGQPASHFIAMKMTTPGLTINNPTVHLVPPPKDASACHLSTWMRKGEGVEYSRCDGIFPLRIGRDLMRSLRMYFATKEQMLYVSAATACEAGNRAGSCGAADSAAADAVTRAQSASRATCGRLKQFASLDLVQASGLLVPVTIQGRSGLMTLDTSSPHSALAESFVKETAGLHDWYFAQPVLLRENRAASTIRFDSFALGAFDSGPGEIYVMQSREASSAALPIIGTLGMDLLEKVDFELDLAHGKLNVFSQDHCPAPVYWTNTFAAVPLRKTASGMRSFPMNVRDRNVEATLATNQALTTLTTDLTRLAYGLDERSAGIQHLAGASGDEERHFILVNMAAPGFTVQNQKVSLIPPPLHLGCALLVKPGKDAALGYENCDDTDYFPLAIGRDLLQDLRLYFATKENVLYFSAANATK